MDCPNLGNHCSVVGLDTTARKLVYRRGFGNILTSVVTNNKISNEIVEFNRLQPLTKPFGNHAPPTADPAFLSNNPQTTLGWDRRQDAPESVYQNQQLGKLLQVDDTQPKQN